MLILIFLLIFVDLQKGNRLDLSILYVELVKVLS